MSSLTVEPRNDESAQAFYNALSEFHPEMIGSADEGYCIKVELVGSNLQVLGAVGVIYRYVRSDHIGQPIVTIHHPTVLIQFAPR